MEIDGKSTKGVFEIVPSRIATSPVNSPRMVVLGGTMLLKFHVPPAS